jgi:HAD superfamily hydrolase (TIGR01549 family)
LARSGVSELRAVLLDVDFTLCRPGPELGTESYVRVGERHGLELDPGRYEEARERAVAGFQRHPQLLHDEELWVAFTERIVQGMGGTGRETRACAVELTQGWESSANFDLYEDVFPVLEELRAHGLKIGLISNGARDLNAFVAHHKLDVDVAVGSRDHGWTKPHESIFRSALERLGVRADEAAMVGDSPEDDVEGARALGMRALLIDRENRFPDEPERLPDLYALPAALGLERPTGDTIRGR